MKRSAQSQYLSVTVGDFQKTMLSNFYLLPGKSISLNVKVVKSSQWERTLFQRKYSVVRVMFWWCNQSFLWPLRILIIILILISRQKWILAQTSDIKTIFYDFLVNFPKKNDGGQLFFFLMKLLQIEWRECLENARVYSTHQLNQLPKKCHLYRKQKV